MDADDMAEVQTFELPDPPQPIAREWCKAWDAYVETWFSAPLTPAEAMRATHNELAGGAWVKRAQLPA